MVLETIENKLFCVKVINVCNVCKTVEAIRNKKKVEHVSNCYHNCVQLSLMYYQTDHIAMLCFFFSIFYFNGVDC